MKDTIEAHAAYGAVAFMDPADNCQARLTKKSVSLRRRYLRIAVTVALFTICALKGAPQDAGGWTVDLRVSSLKFLGAKRLGYGRSGPIIRLEFQNVSQKPITAIAMTTSDGVNHDPDFFGLEPLAPGAVTSFIPGDQSNSSGAKVITVSAVIFADGQSEGDASRVARIQAFRIGWVLETARALQVLSSFGSDRSLASTDVASVKRLLGPPPQSVDEAMDSVKELVGSRPGLTEGVLSSKATRFALFTGMSHGYREVLGDLEEVSASAESRSGVPPEPGRESRTLIDVRNRLKERVARQTAELEQMR